MAEGTDDTRTSYPYMSANQWWGLRSRFKRAVPSGPVTLDWIMGALDTTQKGAGNVLPQLRLLGLTDANNKATELVHDFKDDATYTQATKVILSATYPAALLDAHDDPEADPTRVASWFSRNAKTGERASISQAKLYLLILSGQLPDPEEANAKPKAPRPAARKKAPPQTAAQGAGGETNETETLTPPPVGNGTGSNGNGGGNGPTLHVDLQIHISADAGDAQIDAIFKSMAKHLYGKG